MKESRENNKAYEVVKPEGGELGVVVFLLVEEDLVLLLDYLEHLQGDAPGLREHARSVELIGNDRHSQFYLLGNRGY